MLCVLSILLVTSATCMDTITQDLVTPLKYMGEACGYESCPKINPNILNVHIVPHTHGELGYTHTFYEYYTGYDDFYEKSQINMKRILDYTITELWSKETRKFTFSDMPYFFRWWANRDGTVRRMVYELLRQGRLHFVGGGWSMSDEATTSYHAIVDHFTYSLSENEIVTPSALSVYTGEAPVIDDRKINATFLDCGRPLVTWQADVFGHTREFASLMAQMGFDGHFVSPISYDDELARMRRNALEFVWRGSDDLGAESDIFTHKLFDGYWSPPGFCFGGLCNDPLIVTSDSLFKNIDERTNEFFRSVLHRQAPYYSTNNIMVMMGQRLGYFDASVWFANIDKLIDHANNYTLNGARLNVFYSTPACYLKAVHDAYPQLPSKQDDFLPYAYDSATYATGSYTSRPTIKFMTREGHLYLQTVKQLQVTAQLGNNDKFLEQYDWINGVFQDHNIITGEMRAHVKNYYTQKMYVGTQQATGLIRSAFNKLRGSPTSTVYYRCSFNISCCFNTHGEQFFVVIYNPLAWPVTIPVRLPTYRRDYVVYNPDGEKIRCALIPIPEPVTQIPYRKSKGRYELVFIAEDLPPMGYRSYYVRDRELGWSRPKRSITKKISRDNGKKYYKGQTNAFSDFANHKDNGYEEIKGDNNDEYFDDTIVNNTTEKNIYKNFNNYDIKHERNSSKYDNNYDFYIENKPRLRTELNVYDTSTTTVSNTQLKEVNENDKYFAKVTNQSKDTSNNVEPKTEGVEAHDAVDNVSTTKQAVNVEITDEATKMFTEETTVDDNLNEYSTVTTPTDKFTTRNGAYNYTVTRTPPSKYGGKEVHENRETETITPDNEEFEDPKEKIWRGSQYVEVKDNFIRNRFIKVNMDNRGRIELVELLNGVNMSLDIKFYFYASDDPDRMGTDKKRPGAYIFRAMDPKPKLIEDYLEMKAYKNGLLQELHMQYSDYTSFALRLYRRTPYIELEWIVGPIPCKDEIGKDVFIRYSTDLDNRGVFYTDSNGRQTVKRIRNTRASFVLGNQDPVAGNLYPVTSKIYIEDIKKNIRFSVFNDRAQGGSSMNDGQIDLMLNRQIFTDDSGIQALLNETESEKGLIVRGKHYLYITKSDYKPNRIFEKKFSKEIELRPTVFVSKKSPYGINTKSAWIKEKNEFSAVKTKLPLGVHVLTIEKWNTGTILLRLENYLEKSDVVKSGIKRVVLNNLFEGMEILSANETTLAANMWLKDWVPLQWDKNENFVKNFNEAYGTQNISFREDEGLKPIDDINVNEVVTLSPQQIRTFVLTFKYVT